MARVGFNKSKAKIDTSIVLNKEDSKVYSLSNPAEKLISAVAYMGERGFYPDAAIASSNEFNHGVLDEKGTEILKSAIKLAKSKNPESLLCIAKWARQEMNMRLFPQLLAAAAAKFIRGDDKNTNPVSNYIPTICTRPDDLLQLLALYNCLFGTWEGGYPRARLPGCLQKGMAFSLMTYSPYSLIKHNKPTQHPNFKDLLLTIRGGVLPKRFQLKAGFPLSKAMFEFLVNDKVIDSAPRILQARKEVKEFTEDPYNIPELRPLAKEAGLTLENFISASGKKSNAKGDTGTVSTQKKQLPNLNDIVSRHRVLSVDGLLQKSNLTPPSK